MWSKRLLKGAGGPESDRWSFSFSQKDRLFIPHRRKAALQSSRLLTEAPALPTPLLSLGLSLHHLTPSVQSDNRFLCGLWYFPEHSGLTSSPRPQVPHRQLNSFYFICWPWGAQPKCRALNGGSVEAGQWLDGKSIRLCPKTLDDLLLSMLCWEWAQGNWELVIWRHLDLHPTLSPSCPWSWPGTRISLSLPFVGGHVLNPLSRSSSSPMWAIPTVCPARTSLQRKQSYCPAPGIFWVVQDWKHTSRGISMFYSSAFFLQKK